MNRSISWFHISDLHFKESSHWDSEAVLKSMVEDMKMVQDKYHFQPDFIAITGDIAFSAKQRQYSIAKDFSNNLLSVLNLSEERCFTVPGNHDVSREKVNLATSAVYDYILKSADQSKIADLFSNNTNTDTRKTIFNHLADYAEFAPVSSKITPDQLYYTHHLQSEDLPFRVSIIGLNTAWLALSDDTHGRIVVGKHQLQSALNSVSENDFIIILMHHPIASLAEWDHLLISNMIDHHADVLLNGHFHRSRIELLSQSPYRCNHISAGSSYAGNEKSNNYNAVTVNFLSGKMSIYFRQYRPDAGGIWVEDNSFNKHEPGKIEWPVTERFLLKHKKRKDEPTFDKNFNTFWIKIGSSKEGSEFDADEILSKLKELLKDDSLTLINVKTGSLWLKVKATRETYTKLLESYVSEDQRLSRLAGKYRVEFVGPEPKPEQEKKEKESKYLRKVNIFLASPGDLKQERETVAEIVTELNRSIADSYDIAFNLVRWETHVVPEMGRPQEIINRLLGDLDIFIGILWSRFGTPTGVAESGTLEEFNLAYDLWSRSGKPRIMFYFKETPISLNSVESTEQLMKVMKFKESIGRKGLYYSYSDAHDFDKILREHLTKVCIDISKSI